MLSPADDHEAAGLDFRDEGEIERSLTEFETAVELTCNDQEESDHLPRRRMLLGETLAALGQHAKADEQYECVLGTEAVLPWIWMNTWRLRSTLRLTQGRLGDSKADLAQAMQLTGSISPRDVVALDVGFQSAALLVADGAYDEARNALIDLVDAYPTDASGTRGRSHCQLLLARVALARGDAREAIALAEAIANDEGASRLIRAHAWHLLGEARLAETELPSARVAFENCLAECATTGGIRPEMRRIHAEAGLGLAEFFTAVGQTQRSVGRLRGVVSELTALPDTQVVRARCLFALGMAHLQAAAASTPRDRRAQQALARAALREADFICVTVEGAERLHVPLPSRIAASIATLSL